jgi:GntR family transcriptional regulator
MFIRINPASAVPVYRQIYDQIQYQIATRRLSPGDRLPSVRELARKLAANQNTILKVYDQLATAKLIERRQGDGCFITNAAPVLRLAERRRRLRETLSEAAVQARLFDIPSPEAHDIFTQEIESIAGAEPVDSGGHSA